MRISKDKLPKGLKYPVKTKTLESFIEKYDINGIRSILYTNMIKGPDLISFQFSGYINKTGIIENGTTLLVVRSVELKEFSNELAEQLPAKLEEAFEWLRKLERYEISSTEVIRNRSFEIVINENGLATSDGYY